jgi:hypothetical protein
MRQKVTVPGARPQLCADVDQRGKADAALFAVRSASDESVDDFAVERVGDCSLPVNQ